MCCGVAFSMSVCEVTHRALGSELEASNSIKGADSGGRGPSRGPGDRAFNKRNSLDYSLQKSAVYRYFQKEKSSI